MEMQDKIIEKIKSDYSGWTGEVHKEAIDIVIELIEDYDIDIEDYESTEEFIEVLEDKGYIHEAVDGFIPMYNADLYEWVKDNGHVVMEAMKEYGYEMKDVESFEQMISQGYFYQLENLVREVLFNNWIEEYKEGLENEKTKSV
jgi:GrpB-like predicted nucleotidyltransferase (UPF0157 family)|tara:strand:+ start:350 stop:781 length:432 start_codon:yes stop_codon:yes gene_type:complete